MDFSSGVLNLNEALPDGIHGAGTPSPCPGQRAMQNPAFSGPMIGGFENSAEVRNSENFKFSPDLLPPKQTYQLIPKNRNYQAMKQAELESQGDLNLNDLKDLMRLSKDSSEMSSTVDQQQQHA